MMNKEREFDDESVELSDEDLEKVDGGIMGIPPAQMTPVY